MVPQNPPSSPTSSRVVVTILFGLANLPFLAALALADWLHPFPMTIVVGLILFLVPGLSWSNFRRIDSFEVFFRAVLVSVGAGLAVWLLLAVLPGPTSRTGFLVLLALLTNIGLWRGTRLNRFSIAWDWSSLWFALLMVAALFYVQSYIGAAHRIPALEDQDMETQGTAYGLIHELVPSMVTNRGSSFFFAHPLLLHFWIGESALVSDDLDRLRYYHERSLLARGLGYNEMMPFFDAEFARFQQDPVLLPSRTPNLFLGVFVLFPLAFLVYGASGSRLAALGSCVLYATLPEVYVRSAYGGYMAAANFLSLSGAYFYLRSAGQLPRAAAPAAQSDRRLAGVVSFMGAWVDQKTMLLAGAAAIHALVGMVPWRSSRDSWRTGRWSQAFTAATVAGAFVVGWMTFALYGLAIAPQDFVTDHFVVHFVDRISLETISLDTVWQQKGKYLSIVGLWTQFFTHTGWIVAVAIVISSVWAATRLRGPEGLFFMWIAIGATGFSLVDWRLTKHLAQVAPAMIVVTGLWWASCPRRLQMIATTLLCGAIGWNVWRITRLMVDFSYLSPTPLW